MQYMGQVEQGDFIGTKVTRLKVYSADKLDRDCSTEKGIRYVEDLYGEITFEGDSLKLKCHSDIASGYSLYEPGLVYSKGSQTDAIESKYRRLGKCGKYRSFENCRNY